MSRKSKSGNMISFHLVPDRESWTENRKAQSKGKLSLTINKCKHETKKLSVELERGYTVGW